MIAAVEHSSSGISSMIPIFVAIAFVGALLVLYLHTSGRKSEPKRRESYARELVGFAPPVAVAVTTRAEDKPEATDKPVWESLDMSIFDEEPDSGPSVKPAT